MRLLPSWKRKGDKQVKIPWSTGHARLVREAKAAIGKAEQKDALDILSRLQNAQLDGQVTALNSQLARYRRDVLEGTKPDKANEVTLNRITIGIT